MKEDIVRSGIAKRRRGRLLALWSSWPRWPAYAAALWSLTYGALGLYWALGGAGFSFGRGNDQEAEYSVLVNASAETTAPVIAVLGLLGATVGFVMAKTVGRGFARAATGRWRGGPPRRTRCVGAGGLSSWPQVSPPSTRSPGLRWP